MDDVMNRTLLPYIKKILLNEEFLRGLTDSLPNFSYNRFRRYITLEYLGLPHYIEITANLNGIEFIFKSHHIDFTRHEYRDSDNEYTHNYLKEHGIVTDNAVVLISITDEWEIKSYAERGRIIDDDHFRLIIFLGPEVMLDLPEPETEGRYESWMM